MVVACAFNPITWEADVDKYLWVQGQPGLQSEFQDSQNYTEKPCLNNNNKDVQIVEKIKELCVSCPEHHRNDFKGKRKKSKEERIILSWPHNPVPHLNIVSQANRFKMFGFSKKILL